MFKMIASFLMVGLAALFGCSEPHFTEPQKFVSGEVSAEVLSFGRERYMLNCYACHGENGDGQGPAAAYLRPGPRDFRLGVYKFGGVGAGELPHTDDLVRLVKRGLTGTAMLPWDVSEHELTAIIEYIKTFTAGPEDSDVFSNRWQDPDEELGAKIQPTADPFKGDVAAGVEHGKKAYHVSARCSLCHPSYVSKQELYDMTKAMTGNAPAAFSDGMYRSKLRDSEYGENILPIDFLYHYVKTVSPADTDEQARSQLYVTIGAGVGGTAMPKWQGALSEEDLWGLAYYVQSLMKKQGTKEGLAMREALTNQPEFVPPTVEETPEGTPGEQQPGAEQG